MRFSIVQLVRPAHDKSIAAVCCSCSPPASGKKISRAERSTSRWHAVSECHAPSAVRDSKQSKRLAGRSVVLKRTSRTQSERQVAPQASHEDMAQPNTWRNQHLSLIMNVEQGGHIMPASLPVPRGDHNILDSAPPSKLAPLTHAATCTYTPTPTLPSTTTVVATHTMSFVTHTMS